MLSFVQDGHDGAKEVSTNWTQTLLEENKVFPTLFPKIEKGETILLKAFAKMIREMKKTTPSNFLSSPECCFTYSSADTADPEPSEVPSHLCGATRNSNIILPAF